MRISKKEIITHFTLNLFRLSTVGLMLLVLFLFGLFPVALSSEGSYSALEIPYHARSLGMSAAGAADWHGMDISSINPSLLQSSNRSLLMSAVRYPADIQTGLVEWRQVLGNRKIAITLRHVKYGAFERRDDSGIKTGQFTAGDTWISGSFAQKLYKLLDVGMTGGFFFSQIENVNATLALVSFGTALKIPRFDAQVGVSIRNFGYTLNNYTDYHETIPTSLALGLSKKLAHLPMEISLDGLWWRKEDRAVIRLGGEFFLPSNFKVRWGTSSYRFDLGTDELWQSYIAGSSIGLGYVIKNLTVDMGIHYQGAGSAVIGIGVSTTH